MHCISSHVPASSPYGLRNINEERLLNQSCAKRYAMNSNAMVMLAEGTPEIYPPSLEVEQGWKSI